MARRGHWGRSELLDRRGRLDHKESRDHPDHRELRPNNPKPPSDRLGPPGLRAPQVQRAMLDRRAPPAVACCASSAIKRSQCARRANLWSAPIALGKAARCTSTERWERPARAGQAPQSSSARSKCCTRADQHQVAVDPPPRPAEGMTATQIHILIDDILENDDASKGATWSSAGGAVARSDQRCGGAARLAENRR